MRRLDLGLVAIAVLLLGPGCQFYFGGDDDDCYYGNAAGDAPTRDGVLNPFTLECVYGGPGGGCDSKADPGFRIDPYNGGDWALCHSACEGLSEDSCVASDGCRAIYNETECDSFGCSRVQTYASCVATAPSGPVRGGECSNLGAEECSRHDDCSAVHVGVPGPFARCQAEIPACIPPPVPLGPELRNPESGKCEPYGGGNPCDPNSGVDARLIFPDWGSCESECTGLDETSCKAADACRAIYANVCPPNADCYSQRYKECWPTAPSGPIRGGSCQGLDAHACSQHDDCIAEHDSDWSGCDDTGFCSWTVGRFIDCNDETTPPPPPPPPPACSTLNEAGCIARMDCSPFYQGANCSCSPAGCTCQTWIFDTCGAN